MGTNLRILGMQSIPRLTERLDADVEFPANALIESLQGVEHFQRLSEECGKILTCLFRDSEACWWDVYCNSDIGLERVAIAEEMQLERKDTLLDVGCGRGYFTAAAARLAESVVGLDLMDGLGRHGWWENYSETMRELDLTERVTGVRADARDMPFKGDSFTVAASVHAIRNFQNQVSIVAAIREMKRVVVDGGSVIVVESMPFARNNSQEAHLEMFRCKTKYTSGDLDYLPKTRMVEMFQKAGFDHIETRELDYNWSAAPPIFCIKPYLTSMPDNKREEARQEFEKAADMIRKWGDASPPALLIRGTR